MSKLLERSGKPLELSSEWLKEVVEWLIKNEEGTGFCYDGSTWNGDKLAFVIGWMGGFDDYDSEEASSEREYKVIGKGEYRLVAKFAVNSSALQCDFEFDWSYPYASEVDDLVMYDYTMLESDDYEATVENIKKDWEKFLSDLEELESRNQEEENGLD